MPSLTARVVVGLTASLIVGVALLDVGFLISAERQAARERALGLRATALRVQLELERLPAGAPRALYEARLRELGADEGVVVGLALGSPEAPAPWPEELGPERPRLVRDGHDYAWIEPPEGSAAPAVVVERPLAEGFARLGRTQTAALPLLLGAAALVLGLELFFLRRAVLRPAARLTALVDAQDTDALQRLGSGGGFAHLGRAIVAMGNTIAADRERIAGQLAELRAAHAELQSAQEQLVRSARLAVVGQLAAGAAHEIGNPLAVVRGFVDVLAADSAATGVSDASQETPRRAEERRRALERMGLELDRIQGAVRGLLDFSRASSSAPGVGDVAAALEHVGALLGPQQKPGGVRLEVVTPPVLPPVALRTDALVQVVMNLALNALDAAVPTGQVRISARLGAAGDPDAPQAAAAARAEAPAPAHPTVLIEVEDSGPGVPSELRRRIFDPFFTTKPAGRGTGLGLAVCEGIVGAAGGALTVADSPLGGARFTAAVPPASGR